MYPMNPWQQQMGGYQPQMQAPQWMQERQQAQQQYAPQRDQMNQIAGKMGMLQEQYKGAGSEQQAGIQGRIDKLQGRATKMEADLNPAGTTGADRAGMGWRKTRREAKGLGGMGGGAQPEPAQMPGGGQSMWNAFNPWAGGAARIAKDPNNPAWVAQNQAQQAYMQSLPRDNTDSMGGGFGGGDRWWSADGMAYGKAYLGNDTPNPAMQAQMQQAMQAAMGQRGGGGMMQGGGGWGGGFNPMQGRGGERQSLIGKFDPSTAMYNPFTDPNVQQGGPMWTGSMGGPNGFQMNGGWGGPMGGETGAQRPGMEYRQDRRQARQGGAQPEPGRMSQPYNPQAGAAPQQQGFGNGSNAGFGQSIGSRGTDMYDTPFGMMVASSSGNSGVYKVNGATDGRMYHYDPNNLNAGDDPSGWKSMTEDQYRSYGDHQYNAPNAGNAAAAGQQRENFYRLGESPAFLAKRR